MVRCRRRVLLFNGTDTFFTCINFKVREDMTPYDKIFLATFVLGCIVAGVPAFLAGCMYRSSWSGLLLAIGVVAFWATLVIGSVMGYRAWQSMPDAPLEAFNDASASGALLFGWLPGVVFSFIGFGFGRAARWLLYWANPDLFSDR